MTRICSIEGCGRKHSGHGYCNIHLHRFKYHGDPLAGRTRDGALEEFIADLVARKDEQPDNCVPWPFCKDKRGYGILRRGTKSIYAHRLVCRGANGNPPDGKDLVAHSCGNGVNGCVNPRHLRWATFHENMDDALEHMSHARGERVWTAKLSEDQVRLIRLSDASGTDLAKELGVSRNTVENARTGRTWRHVS